MLIVVYSVRRLLVCSIIIIVYTKYSAILILNIAQYLASVVHIGTTSKHIPTNPRRLMLASLADNAPTLKQHWIMSVICSSLPANTIHWPNAGLMLGRRRRRRASINPSLGRCIVLAGLTQGVTFQESKRWTNAVLLLAQRRRRWASNKTALARHFVVVTTITKRHDSPGDVRFMWRHLLLRRSDVLCNDLATCQ